MRPATLSAAVGPIALGLALGYRDGFYRHAVAALCLITAILLQILANLSNDYFDGIKGSDGPERLGPPRATSLGWLSKKQMGIATLIVTLLSMLSGSYLVYLGGIPILILGIISILAAIAYTAGPYPLAYHGLGEIGVFPFFGPIAVMGSYWLMSAKLSYEAFFVSLGPGLIITAILVVNNFRDRHQDAHSKKKTLAVRFGARFSRIEYLLLILTPYLFSIVLAFFFTIGFLLPLLSLPLAILAIKGVFNEDGRALNRYLAKTAQLSLVYSLLLAIGLFV